MNDVGGIYYQRDANTFILPLFNKDTKMIKFGHFVHVIRHNSSGNKFVCDCLEARVFGEEGLCLHERILEENALLDINNRQLDGGKCLPVIIPYHIFLYL